MREKKKKEKAEYAGEGEICFLIDCLGVALLGNAVWASGVQSYRTSPVYRTVCPPHSLLSDGRKYFFIERTFRMTAVVENMYLLIRHL